MRASVIGVGRMGQRHLQVLQELGLEIAGISDTSAEALESAGAAYGVPPDRRFTEGHTLLERVKPECVIVATTATSHCRYTCLAAGAGARYILCEKPMATSLAECTRMIETCRAHGARLAINHQMRFIPECVEPKRIVSSEAFGGLSSITIVSGNIGIATNGTHHFEMFRYTSGEPPAEVTAWFSEETVPNPRGPQYEDRAGSVRVTTASGRRLYLEVGADQGHGLKFIYTGRYGQLFYDKLQGRMHLTLRKAEYRDLPTTRYASPSDDVVYPVETIGDAVKGTRAVLEALLNDRDVPSGEDGRLAVRTLVAAYVSHENGHLPVRVDDASLPVDRVFQWA